MNGDCYLGEMKLPKEGRIEPTEKMTEIERQMMSDLGR